MDEGRERPLRPAVGAGLRLLDESDVAELLDPERLVGAVGAALADASAGRSTVIPRSTLAGEGGQLLVMGARLPSPPVYVTKQVSVHPGNARMGLPTHFALITLWDAETGRPTAVIEATGLTAMRTAAVSAASIRALAAPGARVLAVLGTGAQAAAHLRLLPRVGDFDEVLIAGRRPGAARELAVTAVRDRVRVRAVETFQEAAEAADVIAVATHSPDPVLRREWLRPGVHVASVGVNDVGQELDDATVRDATVFVEHREAAVQAPFVGCNELRLAVRRGERTAEALIELGDVLGGTHPGRTADDELTLFKSVGSAVVDAAAALETVRAAGPEPVRRG